MVIFNFMLLVRNGPVLVPNLEHLCRGFQGPGHQGKLTLVGSLPTHPGVWSWGRLEPEEFLPKVGDQGLWAPTPSLTPSASVPK